MCNGIAMSTNDRPACVLLAGGRATRMGGGDKALRQLAGRTLLDHVIDRMRPQVSAMALNANGDPARFAAYGLEVIADPLEGQPGPLAGVLAGLRWAAARGRNHVISVPIDTPFLPENLVARLTAAGNFTCAASGAWVHPVIGLWPVALADALEADLLAGERRIGPWAKARGVVPVHFTDDAAFRNLNHPQELDAAERDLAGQQGKRAHS
jgi:molybdopterin-guanine dinucleotide biosynthesis protein A